MPVSAQQLAVMDDGTSEWILLSGSVRSGKSFVANLKLLTFLRWGAEEGVPILLCAKKLESIERNIITPLMDAIESEGLSDQFVLTRSPFRLTYITRKITLYCAGANDESAEEGIRGLTVQALFCDEATLYPRGFFLKALDRCSTGRMIKIMTCNPEGPAHWFYKEIYTQIGKAYPGKVYQFRLTDNPSLTDSFKAQLKARYQGSEYKRFVDGEWCASDRLVYNQFNDSMITEDYPNGYELERFIGIDWGYEHNMALTLMAILKDGRMWAIDEIVGSHKLVDHFLRGEIQTKGWLKAPITDCYYPPERPDLGEQLRLLFADQRQSLNCLPANNDVHEGIDHVQLLMSQNKFHVLTKCQTLIQELRTYQRKADKDGNTLDDVVKVGDDSVDSLRYAIHSYNPGNRAWDKFSGISSQQQSGTTWESLYG